VISSHLLQNPLTVSFVVRRGIVLLHTMQRVKQLVAHLGSFPGAVSALQRELPDDVVITMAIRSPLCKAKKGSFKDARYVRDGWTWNIDL
jgi:hypothetical protein